MVTEDWYFLSHRVPMARAAAQLGLDVHVATRDSGRGSEIARLGFTYHALARLQRGPVRPFTELRAANELRNLIRRVDPGLVQLVAIKPIILGLIATLASPRVVLCTYAGLGSALGGGGRRTMLSRALGAIISVTGRRNTVDAIVQNTDDWKMVTERFGLPPARVHLIEGSGIDTRSLGLADAQPPATVRYAFAGRLLADKGIRELLEAFTGLREGHPDVELLIIGDIDPTNPTSLTPHEVRQAALRPGVRMVGRKQQDEVVELLRGTSVAVLPSYGEGLPRFLLEAGALGLPLITSDVPGCRSVVTHEETGLLVRPADVQSLQAAMAQMASDPRLRGVLGANARARVLERFDSKVIGERMRSVYSSLLTTEEAPKP